jgi:hypothetical protein
MKKIFFLVVFCGLVMGSSKSSGALVAEASQVMVVSHLYENNNNFSNAFGMMKVLRPDLFADKQKAPIIVDDRRTLFDIVTAPELDNMALTTLSSKFDDINTGL